MKAIIFAAGKGNRLKPLTDEIPKTLLPISNNKKILDLIIDSLPDEISEIIIVAKHKIEKVHEYKKTSPEGNKITIIEQGDIRGTLGALLSVKHLIQPDEKFLVLNGDDLQSKEDLNKYISKKRAFGVQKMNMPYYAIEIENQIVTGWHKQSDEEKKGEVFIATGTYVLDCEIFNLDPIKITEDEFGLPQTILNNKSYEVEAVETVSWTPINTNEEYEKAKNKFY